MSETYKDDSLAQVAASTGHQAWSDLCVLRDVLLRQFGWNPSSLSGREDEVVRLVIDAVHDKHNPRQTHD